MQLLTSVEHLILLILIFALSYLWWLHHQQKQGQAKKKDKKKTKPRQWRPKSPSDCPACQSGVQLSIQPIWREVKP
jgi:hypothetical protein